MDLSERELATMLAALREWQGILAGDEPAATEVDYVASDGGKYQPLSPEEIDDLCERLNTERGTA